MERKEQKHVPENEQGEISFFVDVNDRNDKLASKECVSSSEKELGNKEG